MRSARFRRFLLDGTWTQRSSGTSAELVSWPGRADHACGGQSTIPERSCAQTPLSEQRGGTSAPPIENDLGPTDVRERPRALAGA